MSTVKDPETGKVIEVKGLPTHVLVFFKTELGEFSADLSNPEDVKKLGIPGDVFSTQPGSDISIDEPQAEGAVEPYEPAHYRGDL